MKRAAYRSRDSFAQVNWAMVEELGDITLAAIFDWIAWKADPAYEGVSTGDDGGTWYTASLPDLADTMKVSEKVIWRAITKLVDGGHLEATELRRGGNGDRTRSYRPIWDESDHLPKREDRSSQTGGSDLPEREGLDLPKRAGLPIPETVKQDVKDDLSLIAPSEVQAEVPDDVTFVRFWTAWPRRVERKAAERAWTKALDVVQQRMHGTTTRLEAAAVIVSMVDAWAAQWRAERRDPVHIPHAATWLNGERWTDEIPTAGAPPGKPPQQTNAQRALQLAHELREREVHDGEVRDGSVSRPGVLSR